MGSPAESSGLCSSPLAALVQGYHAPPSRNQLLLLDSDPDADPDSDLGLVLDANPCSVPDSGRVSDPESELALNAHGSKSKSAPTDSESWRRNR